MGVLKFHNDKTHTIALSYNTVIKKYSDGTEKLKYHSYSTFKGLPNNKKKSGGLSEEEKDYQRYKNLYKSKQTIIDLAYENSLDTPWEYFVTLTFDDKKVNARHYDYVVENLSSWLDNMKHQNRNMKYILVPELHKSGRVHFHGIFKNVSNWKLEKAYYPGTNRLIKKNGLQIYNLTNYKYGFTTVSKVKDMEAISVYISKYMTKELIDQDFKKRYWCSQGLNRPKIEYAHFNEDTLKFYIDNHNLKDYKEVVKENCSSVFLRTAS